MSYFDDRENRNHDWQLEPYHRKSPKTHITDEKFVDGVDGRFAMRKTLCGLEYPQSSNRVARNKKRVTCKKCLEIKK